tara:strand:+ start:6541 stop:6816 length:276 start_codon:yes stop_codon:yes gene_type:complete
MKASRAAASNFCRVVSFVSRFGLRAFGVWDIFQPISWLLLTSFLTYRMLSDNHAQAIGPAQSGMAGVAWGRKQQSSRVESDVSNALAHGGP